MKPKRAAGAAGHKSNSGSSSSDDGATAAKAGDILARTRLQSKKTPSKLVGVPVEVPRTAVKGAASGIVRNKSSRKADPATSS